MAKNGERVNPFSFGEEFTEPERGVGQESSAKKQKRAEHEQESSASSLKASEEVHYAQPAPIENAVGTYTITAVKKREPKNNRVSFMLTDTAMKKLNALCRISGRTRNDMINELLKTIDINSIGIQ